MTTMPEEYPENHMAEQEIGRMVWTWVKQPTGRQLRIPVLLPGRGLREIVVTLAKPRTSGPIPS
jgi:hypothetical protein